MIDNAIDTAKTYHRCGMEQFTASVLAKKGKDLPTKTHAKLKVRAEINAGRYIVKCPFCSGAELADKDDKRFFCLSCMNKEVNGEWIQVEFPQNDKKIEELLLKRPVENRNWLPGETIKKLESDNKKYLGVV